MNLEKTKFLVICVILALGTFIVFWPVRNFQFINFDDHVYITDNPYVYSGLARTNILWAFTTAYSSNWHPLTWLSHMIDCQLFSTNPGWHHIINLLFHIINTLLLFTFLSQITCKTGQSFFVAALFALHPLHVESVAWVAERKDVLSTMFWFLTIIAYVSYIRHRGIIKYLLIVALFALGLMAKPMLVTLPFVLLLFDYWPIERFKKEKLHYLILEKIPLFIFSAASCIVTVIAQRSGGALESTETIPLGFRMANAILSYAKYIQKTFWPTKLAFFYPHPATEFNLLLLLVSLSLLLAISVYVISQFNKRKYLLVGWLWFIGTLVPVIGFVQVGAQAMADRYTYVPLIGIFMIVTWGVSDLFVKLKCPRYLLTAAALVVLVFLSICSRIQVLYWRDSTALFEHALEVTEKNYTAHSCLAYVLCEQGKINEAIAHNRLAIKFNPAYLDAQFNLGNIFLQQGNLNDALNQFYNVLQIDPDYIKAHRNIAKILIKQDKPAQAIPHYENILKVQPDDYDAQNGLGIVLARIGKFNEAFEHFNRALQVDPDRAEIYNNLGFTFIQQGKFDEAELQLTKALKLDPNNSKTHYQFARVLSEKNDLNNAVAHLRESLRLDPNNIESMNKLAWFLCTYKQAEFFDPNEAVRIASRAYELTRYQDPATIDILASACSAAGNHDEAVNFMEKALNLRKADSQLKAEVKELPASSAEKITLRNEQNEK